MLDIQYIRDNKEEVLKAIKHKKNNVDIEKLLTLDDQRRELIGKVQELREERNKLAKKGNTDEARTRGRELKTELKKLEEQLRAVELSFEEINLKVPNLMHPDMPIGEDDSENVVLRTWGKPTEHDFDVRDHVELGELNDIIDIKTASHVSGPRFYYLKNQAVQLQFAIINYVMSTVMNKQVISEIAQKVGNPNTKPFSPILPPVIMKAGVMDKMDRLHPTDDRFYFEKDDLVFVGSAEHTLGPMHMDSTLNEDELPIRYIGYSTAFRREAGSYGKDTRGILRVHQFDKLEFETFSTVETGEAEQDLLVGIQEHMLQELEIPYQVVNVCSGDTGKPDYRQIDIECWIPSQGTYRETHSADYMTDFQARRLNIRYQSSDGEKKYVYMNDATAFAVGRLLIAILENYQQEDGSITMPKVLQPFLGFDTISV